MTKKLLLTAVAVGALGFAGTASAQSADRFFGFRATGNAGAITSLDVNGDGVFAIANEISADDLDAGELALVDNLGDGNAIPSGNNLYTIRLTNATFGSPVTSANFTGLNDAGVETPANCTVTVSTGGDADDVQVELLVSSTGAGACSGFNIDLPILPDTVGTVNVSANLRTEVGNPIDGGLVDADVISLVDAFQPTFAGQFTADAGGAGIDDRAELPDYTTLTGEGRLGRLALYVDLDAHRSLDPADDVLLTDVEDLTVTVDGNFAAFNGAAGTITAADPTLEGNAPDVSTNTQVVYEDAQTYVPEDLATKPSPTSSAFVVVPDGGVIQSSSYNATISYTLDPAVYSAQPDAESNNATTAGPIFGTPFESIEREGTTVLLPWMNSSATAATTGTNNIVRVSNIGGDAAIVRGAVVSSSQSGFTVTGAPVVLGTAAAGGELVLTAAELAALGNFGRGDVQIIVEADPELITVKRYAILANGSVTEFESGTVASDQNVELVP